MTALRILISNDDGHFSGGIAALERAAATLSDDVWVVAPDKKRSSMGHQISLHEPFEITRLSEHAYRPIARSPPWPGCLPIRPSPTWCCRA